MTDQLQELANKLVLLAGEAIELAEAYSGGESETAADLTKQLETLVAELDSIAVDNYSAQLDSAVS
jgi:hypothetical protein